MTHVQPFHQFKITVAQRLQKAPFNWVGAAGFELASKYEALIQQCWTELEFADAAASLVHNTHIRRPVDRVRLPTMASMTAVGCKFHKA
jgi:hypothetical protein